LCFFSWKRLCIFSKFNIDVSTLNVSFKSKANRLLSEIKNSFIIYHLLVERVVHLWVPQFYVMTHTICSCISILLSRPLVCPLFSSSSQTNNPIFNNLRKYLPVSDHFRLLSNSFGLLYKQSVIIDSDGRRCLFFWDTK